MNHSVSSFPEGVAKLDVVQSADLILIDVLNVDVVVEVVVKSVYSTEP